MRITMPDQSIFAQRPVARLVLPFDFEPGRLSSMVGALTAAAWPGAERLWQSVKPRASYVDELTPQAESMLFAGSGERHAGAHLRVDETLVQRWFQGLVLQPERREPVALKIVPEVGIEVFLNGHGGGALSIALELSAKTAAQLLDATYRLAQRHRRRGDPSSLRIPHPSEDLERWAKIPDAQKAALEAELSEVPDDAPLSARLGRRGARFTLSELAEALLTPLERQGCVLRDGSFLVYTVARFNAEVEFDATDAHPLSGALVGLSQVEESTHAGGGHESVRTVLLNYKHLAAVSAQGAAHFVADQEGVGFNEERVPRVRDKYFVPYLTSILQRSALRRLNAGIHEILASSERSADRLRALRLALLELGASGMPTETSTRGAVQQYADTCRSALAIADVYDRAERGISGIEQVLASKRLEDLLEAQRDTAAKSEKNLHAAHQLHAAVAWLEIFIVTAYTAEILHLLEQAYAGHGGAPSDDAAAHGAVQATAAGDPMHVLLYIAVMIFAGGLAAWVLKPWRHGHD